MVPFKCKKGIVYIVNVHVAGLYLQITLLVPNGYPNGAPTGASGFECANISFAWVGRREALRSLPTMLPTQDQQEPP